MSVPLQIPIFPLGSVLFPAGRLHLRIFEPRYVEMTRACIAGNSVFGVALIRAGYEVGAPAVPCDVGCTARIVQWRETSPDRYELTAQGESVFRILRRSTAPGGLVMGEVDLVEPPDPLPVPPRHEAMGKLLADWLDQLGPGYFPGLRRLADAAWLGYRIAELLPVTPERKQALLEQPDPLLVLDALERMLEQLRNPGDRD